MSYFGRKPKFLSELLPAYIERSPNREKFIQEMVLSVFHEAVGSRISEQVSQVRFHNKTLMITVKSAVWRQELHMIRPQLKAKLNERVGEPAVFDIRVVA